MGLRRIFGLVVLVMAAVVIGCGGDEGSDESSEPAQENAPTKEEFIAEADQICADGDAEIDQAAEEAFGQGPPSPEEGEQFIAETVLPSIQTQVDGIRDLTPPEGDEETITEFLDTAQSAVDEAEQDPSALAEGGQGGAGNPFGETQQLAADYGFENCAQ